MGRGSARRGFDGKASPLVGMSAASGVGQAGRAGPAGAVTPETWRTSWSAARCNKLAVAGLEQAVEAGRNGKGGRCWRDGSLQPKDSCLRGADRDRTGSRCVDGEGLWTTPREEFQNAGRVSRAATQVVGAQRGRVSWNRTDKTEPSKWRRSSRASRTRSQDRLAGNAGKVPRRPRCEERRPRRACGKGQLPATRHRSGEPRCDLDHSGEVTCGAEGQPTTRKVANPVRGTQSTRP